MGDTKVVEISGEKIYLKKGLLDWKVVHPWKNEDGSINWFNFTTGGWGNLIQVLIYIIIAVVIYFGFHELTTQCESAIEQLQQYQIPLLNQGVLA